MAPVISVAGLKGGIGKTSTAMALASAAAADGPVLLIDADPNGSAVRWHNRGEVDLGFDCCPIQSAGLQMQRRQWELVLMDTAGGIKEQQQEYAKGSSFVLCPCQPAASSLEQVLDLAELLQPTGTPFAVVMTLCDSRSKQEAIRARKLLQMQGIEVLDQQITSLSAWKKAEMAGVCVKDARSDSGRPDPGGARAWEEVQALYAELKTRLAQTSDDQLNAA